MASIPLRRIRLLDADALGEYGDVLLASHRGSFLKPEPASDPEAAGRRVLVSSQAFALCQPPSEGFGSVVVVVLGRGVVVLLDRRLFS